MAPFPVPQKRSEIMVRGDLLWPAVDLSFYIAAIERVMRLWATSLGKRGRCKLHVRAAAASRCSVRGRGKFDKAGASAVTDSISEQTIMSYGMACAIACCMSCCMRRSRVACFAMPSRCYARLCLCHPCQSMMRYARLAMSSSGILLSPKRPPQ